MEEVAAQARLRANIPVRNADRQYVLRRAVTSAIKRDAYGLRHQSYLHGGYIDPRPDGLFLDRFDPLPTSQTIVVYENRLPVASVRVCFFSRDNVTTAPAGVTFPDEVSELLDGLPAHRGRVQGAEITRLVRSPAAENNQGLVFLLLRAAGYVALQEDVPLLISCVRQNHVAFYRRIGCYPAGDLRPYPGLKCPMQLLACPRESYDDARAAFPIMDPMAGPASAFDGFMQGRPVIASILPQSWRT